MRELINVFNYIEILGIIGGFVAFIRKIAPVSNLTADIVEVKLFSKEKRLLVTVVKYLFNTFIATAFMFIFVEFAINRLESIPLLLVSLLMIVNLILFYILLIASTFNSFRYSQIKRLIKDLKVRWIVKWVYSLQKQILLKKLLILFFYILQTYISISSCLSYIIFKSGIYLGVRNGSLDDFIAVIIFTFLFSLLIPVLFKPGLSLVNWDNGKQIAYIKDEKDNKKWFILQPAQKNYVLLGNEKEESICTQKKLVQKEDLINKIIYLE
ncbi:hypothetical protein KHA93_16875 [Bacillus sp. FJAT-49732]|uniref:Uncharacterized protein n=1 Tax=Lederbergia citrisecunda TaxID=2833583 RepID=A0A942TQZ9_9BACI|nr:hypothetical protein [Lederbergia citrisecunda]MBS4201312.1 hypothetical protein [Lederbergia citrisecunda]